MSTDQNPGRAQFRDDPLERRLRAGQGSDSDRLEALDRLCRSYWYPLYSYARRRGNSAPDAEDLVQGFFAKIMERTSKVCNRPVAGSGLFS